MALRRITRPLRITGNGIVRFRRLAYQAAHGVTEDVNYARPFPNIETARRQTVGNIPRNLPGTVRSAGAGAVLCSVQTTQNLPLHGNAVQVVV